MTTTSLVLLLVVSPRFGAGCARAGRHVPVPGLADGADGGSARPPGPAVPDPQFPHRCADPGSTGRPRWASCPTETMLHLVDPAQVVAATAQGHAVALCGLRLRAGALTLTDGGNGGRAVCSACLTGIAAPARWVRSPYDTLAHLLDADGDQPTGGCGHSPPRQARCGAELPGIATVHTRPRARRCAECDLFDLADEYAPGPGRNE
ncbi:MAG: hypothetical protein ACRDSF_23305 [Pseudonocardiaceae bacterium]